MSQVVIQGAGIAGCALALLLGREGHEVTVIERASAPRSGVQAVDVRGPAVKVVEQMGLADDIRARRTKLRGMSVYNESGREIETTTERTLSGGRLDSEDIELFRDDPKSFSRRRRTMSCTASETRSRRCTSTTPASKRFLSGASDGWSTWSSAQTGCARAFVA